MYLFRKFKVFMFDLDGTIWNWTELVPFVKKTINTLLKKGKRVYFITNVALLSRAEIAKKLTTLGIPTREDQVINSGYVAAKYFKENKINKVFVVGEKGLLEELDKEEVTVSDDAKYVLYSIDRNFTFWKLKKIYDLILNGAKLYTTGNGVYWKIGEEIYPAELPFLKSINVLTGKEPISLGKPSEYMKNRIFEDLLLFPEETVFIGDHLDDDIAFANNCGFASVLVLTGVTSSAEGRQAVGVRKPGMIIKNLSAIYL